jgi:hypothetical protein
MTFEKVQDRLLQAKREHPEATWPEILLRRQEHRAMVAEVRLAGTPTRRARLA